jgi:hypothetical protein
VDDDPGDEDEDEEDRDGAWAGVEGLVEEVERFWGWDWWWE